MRILFLILVTIPFTSYAQSIHSKTKSHAELQATIRAATAEAEQESDIESHSEEDFIVDFAVKEAEEIDEEDYYVEDEYVDKVEYYEEVPPAPKEVIAEDQIHHVDTSPSDDIGIEDDVVIDSDEELVVVEEIEIEDDIEIADTTPYEQIEKIDVEKSIEIYIDELQQKDPEVLHVSITEGMIDFEYTNSAKILGLIPIQFRYSVIIEDDSTFSINEPWWLMFVSDSLAIFKRELRTALSTIPDATETEERQKQTLKLLGTVSQMVQFHHDKK